MFYLYFVIVIILNGYFHQILINAIEYLYLSLSVKCFTASTSKKIDKCFTVYIIKSFIF